MRLVLLLSVLLTAPIAAAQEKRLPKELLSGALRRAECTVSMDEASRSLVLAGKLPGGRQLLAATCWHGAYSYGSLLFVLNPKRPREARLLRFKVPDDANTLVERVDLPSPDYDAKSGVLHSLQRRNFGDCGTAGEWRWNGKNFELLRYWNKHTCDGETFDLDSKDKRWLVYPPKR